MIPNAKLGLLIFWPTFWTGVPLKLVIVLLMLASHVHPWEGGGLPVLLLLSIPIDVWALGLCARTVFLERLRLDPPQGMGRRLWWQWALVSAVYLLPAYLAVHGAYTVATRAAAGTIQLISDAVVTVPIAERISLELVMMSVPVTMVILVALYGWLFVLGMLAQRFVRESEPVDGTLQDIVHTWDLLRIPKDQPLLLAAFTGTAVALVVVFWGLLPVSTPHPHEEYEFVHVDTAKETIVPQQVIDNAERVLNQAEATIRASGSSADAGVGKPSRAHTTAPAKKPSMAPSTPSSKKRSGGHAHDDHPHTH